MPRQPSSGGQPKLLAISKRGDSYLRTLLIPGARAVLQMAERRTDTADSWLQRLVKRRPRNVAAVALANKNARIVWALLTGEEPIDPDTPWRVPRRESAGQTTHST